MKKILLFLSFLLMSIGMFGGTVTFTAGTDTGTGSVTKGGITVSMSTMNRSDNYRCNSGTQIQFTSTVGNITQIEITCTGSDDNNYGPGKFSGWSGYTSQYINVYKPNANFSYDDKGYFNPEQDNYMPNMRRSPGDKANGSETVTVDGYSATISWNVEAGFLGLAYWVITYSDGTSETFWGTFNQAKSHAARVAADKAKAQAEKMASNPGDPYADPIGSFPLGLLLILVIIYSYYKKRKTMG